MERQAKEAASSITTHPPEYWRTLEATDPTLLVTLEADMAKLQSEMHDRKRKEKRKQINKAVVVRDASREMGKVGRVIKSVFGYSDRDVHCDVYKNTERARGVG